MAYLGFFGDGDDRRLSHARLRASDLYCFQVHELALRPLLKPFLTEKNVSIDTPRDRNRIHAHAHAL